MRYDVKTSGPEVIAAYGLTLTAALSFRNVWKAYDPKIHRRNDLIPLEGCCDNCGETGTNLPGEDLCVACKPEV